jgi:branched-chain amino acid transport system substrate-binding protein
MMKRTFQLFPALGFAIAAMTLGGCNKAEDKPKTTEAKPATPAASTTAAAPAAAATDPIKIGVIGPFTGGSSPMGLSMRDGVRLAAKQINAGGGVMGRQLELIERDDQATNERGAQVTQELLASQKVAAILGYINTGVAKASVRYPNESKTPAIINVATGIIVNDYFKDAEGKAQENFLFSMSANDTIQSDMIVSQFVDKQGFKKIAVLADDTNYGQSGREFVENELKKRGITAVYTGKFKIKDTDMTPQLQEAKAAGAEALIVFGIGPENAQIANGRAKLGWMVPMIGSWTMSMSNFIDNATVNGEGVMMPQSFIQDSAKSDRQKTFVADYLKEFKPQDDRIPVAVAPAQGYDSLYVMAEAIKDAGSTDGTKVRDALCDLKTPVSGVVTTYTKPFTPTNHIALKKTDVGLGVVKGGRVAPAVQ